MVSFGRLGRSCDRTLKIIVKLRSEYESLSSRMLLREKGYYKGRSGRKSNRPLTSTTEAHR